MAINVTSFSNLQEMEVGINGPDGADRLYVYTGTAIFSFKGESESHWKRDVIQFHVGRNFGPGQVVKAIGSGSLASIYNRKSANYAGWAIDDADADWDDEDGRIQVRASVAVRDTDGYVLRMSFTVHVLANTIEATKAAVKLARVQKAVEA